MKLFGKFLLAALVIAFLLPFTLLKGKDGRPLMSFDKISMPSLALPQLPDIGSTPKIQSQPANGQVIYQWRDEKGELNFTTTAPPKGIDFTEKAYDPNMNLIQSVRLKSEPDEEASEQPVKKKAADIGNPYSPAKVEKLMEDAQNIEKLLNDRFKKQEAMLGQ
jgi:hypothetical protein